MKNEKDFKEFIELLNSHKARYVIVGGYAFSYHAEPRFTKDLDFFIDRSKENSRRMVRVLEGFGFKELELEPGDFEKPGQMIQLGYAPLRIDIVTSISGVSFEQCWRNKVAGKFGGVPAFYISVKDLIRNKRAAGRPQDLVDADKLRAYAKKK